MCIMDHDMYFFPSLHSYRVHKVFKLSWYLPSVRTEKEYKTQFVSQIDWKDSVCTFKWHAAVLTPGWDAHYFRAEGRSIILNNEESRRGAAHSASSHTHLLRQRHNPLMTSQTFCADDKSKKKQYWEITA